jgi:hypothetical protein
MRGVDVSKRGSSRKRNLGPLLERTVENAQRHLLATRYDLSIDSVLAGEIVRNVNQRLDEGEKARGVVRVRPGELFLKTPRGDIILPLRTQAEIENAISGERFPLIRDRIITKCVSSYKALFSDCGEEPSGLDVEKLRRALMPSRGFFKNYQAGEGIHRIPICRKTNGPVKEDVMVDILKDTQRAYTKASLPADFCNQELFHDVGGEIKEDIINFLGSEAGVPPAVREALFLDLARLRAQFCPLASSLCSGQMPLVSMHVKAGRRLELPTRLQPLAPVVVTLITAKEFEELGGKSTFPYEELMAFHARRMARVLVEAYWQDGLICYSELQWCFLMSSNSIGRILGWYQHKHNVILPSPGTVLDMGRMLTHKDIIVRLHLQGLTVLEISRQTYHAPRSVDAYLKVFDSVLILHLYGLPKALIARVLTRGVSLIEEYLELIRDNLKEVKEIRDYLHCRGVKLPMELMAS